jgi:NAD-dependent isocitrate dehydrogenase
MSSTEPRTVTLIKGDGIGPEIADAAVAILAAADAPVRWEVAEAGLNCIEKYGVGLPPETMQSIVRNRVALKGPTTTPIGGGHKSINVSIRKGLDLFANVRPCKSLPGVHTRFENVDLIIVRENIEDTYGGIEHMQTPDVAQCLRLITRPGSLAVARHAFDLARLEGRKRVTCVQKANIHKITDGLFLDCFRQVAAENSDIASDEILIDNCCMQLVTNPQRFDVLVTPNLFGDIISDLCAGLIGGLGVAPGGNIGRDRAVFEAVHGSAPDIAGKGLANPMALILSAVHMLRYLGFNACANRVESGVRLALVDGIRTHDLGGSASTLEFTRAVIAALPAPDRDLEKTDHSGARAASALVRPPAKSPTGPVSAAGAAGEKWTCKGVDIFVRNDGLPDLPKQVGPLSLKLISNRGQKVWPGEFRDILLVDCHRCRYLADGPIGDDEIAALVRAISKEFSWMHIEKLHQCGSEARYSKAQGE